MKSRASKKTKAHTRYKLEDGTLIPGISTIISQLDKPFLINWANKLGLEGIHVGKYTDELADIGSVAHEHIRATLIGEKPEFDDYTATQLRLAKPCIRKFQDWYEQNDVKPLLIEQPLISEVYGYGGTLDLYAEVKGRLTLLDWKTGSRFYPSHKIQLAANSNLLNENGYDLEVCMLISIGRDDKEDFHTVEVGGLRPRFKLFQKLLEVYKLRKELGDI